MPPKLKLTRKEINMLQYPPTQFTWECDCARINSKSSGEKCIWCGLPKPEDPKLLWPEYTIACYKVGIEPGKQIWNNGIIRDLNRQETKPTSNKIRRARRK